MIVLPPRRMRAKRPDGRRRARAQKRSFQPVDFTNGDLTLIWAKGNAAEVTWNALVKAHHYLGHRIVVGRCIKYLVKRGDEIVAAICFSSASWQLAERDALLAEVGIPPWELRSLVINNSRYLILPKDNVQNLASRILALATSRIAADWEGYYSVKPYVAETFVDPSRFYGTCYKAANWIEIGATRGFRKSGSNHSNNQVAKTIFLYGLSRKVRLRLKVVVGK